MLVPSRSEHISSRGGGEIACLSATDRNRFPRRTFLKVGALGAAAAAVGSGGSIIVPRLRQRGLMSADGLVEAASMAWADSIYKEVFPTSPLIINPFSDELKILKALSPVPNSAYTIWANPPGPGNGQQNSLRNEAHQLWPSAIGYPDPIVYQIKVQVNTHSFTSSQVLPINSSGLPTISFDSTGKKYPAGRCCGRCRRARSTGSTARSLGR